MMKMYHRAIHAGEPAYWEQAWSTSELETAVRFCEIDPLRPLFERYAPAGSRLFEGGCGQGHYLIYYGGRGVRVYGLDFAEKTLHRLKERMPEARLGLGDVSRLPFADGCFDVYYSGGVVEHFEAGPGPALLEARRVLRDGGVFLVSVPYLSPLRRASQVWRSDREVVKATETRPSSSGREFWQYAFGRQEFAAILEAAGFRIRDILPYAILFGLYDIPVVETFLGRRAAARASRSPRQPETPHQQATGPDRAAPSLLKRVFVAEDRDLPVLGPLIELGGRACANMTMYVAAK